METRGAFPLRQITFGGLLLLLSACAATPKLGEEGNVDGYLGGIAADEPRAALIGRDILSAGGSAADAAAATYFALAVTYPHAAALGGGGSCLYYDRKSNKVEALEFPIRRAAAGGPVGVPGNVRGFTALQARYGVLKWSSVLAPAESLARFGVPVSRAFAAAGDSLPLDTVLNEPARQVLMRADGRIKDEGDTLEQVALSTLLARLRIAGGADLYIGQAGKLFVEGANQQGARLSMDDMRATLPRWRKPRQVEAGNLRMNVIDNGGGRAFSAFWSRAYRDRGILDQAQKVSPREFADAAAAALQEVPETMPVDSRASTGFVAIDSKGNAASCVVSMGRPFGTGRLNAIDGVLMAPSPVPGADESAFITPLLGVNLFAKDFYLAAAGTGAQLSVATVGQIGVRLLSAGEGLAPAIAAPRVFRARPGAPVLAEKGAMQGGDIVPVRALGLVNAAFCSRGSPSERDSCAIANDPRGYGLATGGEGS